MGTPLGTPHKRGLIWQLKMWEIWTTLALNNGLKIISGLMLEQMGTVCIYALEKPIKALCFSFDLNSLALKVKLSWVSTQS